VTEAPTIRQGQFLIGPINKAGRDLVWCVTRIRELKSGTKATMLGWEGNEKVYATIEVEATFPDGKITPPFKLFEFEELVKTLNELNHATLNPDDDDLEDFAAAMQHAVELVDSRA
jgi:hypothetical protein